MKRKVFFTGAVKNTYDEQDGQDKQEGKVFFTGAVKNTSNEQDRVWCVKYLR